MYELQLQTGNREEDHSIQVLCGCQVNKCKNCMDLHHCGQGAVITLLSHSALHNIQNNRTVQTLHSGIACLTSH